MEETKTKQVIDGLLAAQDALTLIESICFNGKPGTAEANARDIASHRLIDVRAALSLANKEAQ